MWSSHIPSLHATMPRHELLQRGGLGSQPTPVCKKFKIAYEFLSKHEWPDKLTDTSFDRCYCESCYPKNLGDTLLINGKTYVCPRGYTRIGLHIDTRFAEHHKIWDTWNSCYHGTSIKNVISIIENRGLLLPGDETMDGRPIKIRPGHIPGRDEFFTTPSINYAKLPGYASSYDFKSPSDGNTYSVTVVMQLKQKPGSFVVERETVGAGGKRLCPYIRNEELEWKSKQRTSIVPYGVLLFIENVGKQFTKRVSSKLSFMRPMRTDLYDSLLSHLTDWVQVECPHCQHLNDWINPSENQGIILTCESIWCRAKFKPMKCPHCTVISTFCGCCYSRFSNETYFECGNSKCGKQLLSRKCPHCSVGFNFCKVPQDNQVVSVKCSERRCKKEYQVFMCPHCKAPKNGKHGVFVATEGPVVSCDDYKCLKGFQLAKCPLCLNVNVCRNITANPIVHTFVKCAYKGCHNKFEQPLPMYRR